MTKLIIFFCLTLAALAQMPPDMIEPVESKPIVWDKFEVATNKAGVSIGGKSVDKDGNIFTTFVATDHHFVIGAGKVSVTGANGAGQHNAPKDTLTAVASGYSHSVGLTDDGRVVCWGYTTHGQCTPPEGMGKCVAVAAGHSHSMALNDKGKVWEWGNNGDTNRISILDTLPPIVKIDASGNTSVAVDAVSNVYIWDGGQPIKYGKEK
jgi:alpha-tubulin suppressor-like RCC1 family protein